MIKEKAIGISIGASTISAVELSRIGIGKAEKITKVILRAHEGNPRAVFQQVIDELDCNCTPILITGRKFRSYIQIPSITEPEAVEYALSYVMGVMDGNGRFDALISAGGETFMVYLLDKNHKVVGISTGNKCASGTGEFFLQQIKRMNLDIESAVDSASRGKPYIVSGRCSVFCKSDCTHALNKGEPISNVTAGLCRMIAGKMDELLATIPHKKIMVVGGTARNRVVIDSLRERLAFRNEQSSLTVPKEAPYFEALGAAIAAFKRGKVKPSELYNPKHSNFTFMPPLRDFESLVTFKEITYGTLQKGEPCIVGLDVGSTTTKAVLMRITDDSIVAHEYLRTNGNPVESSRACLMSIVRQIGFKDIKVIGIGVTGSGRKITGLYCLTDGVINEIIAHAAAAAYCDPDVDTIFEIGGQDAKYTHLTNGVASDYAMNEACSAGTGSFLEESAYESLGVRMEDIADLAVQGNTPPNFSDQCAAFISSDIKNAAHEGISKEDILAGLVYSICFNYVNRVKGYRPVGKKLFMQGGVCYNRAVPLAMAGIFKREIIVPPEPGLMGAFGVALELKKRIELGLIKKLEFKLHRIIDRTVEYESPFICKGGKEKCDLKCSINRIRIEKKLYPFGGACNRYYNIHEKAPASDDDLDYVKRFNQLIFEKYVPPYPIDPRAPRIGISTSFLTNRLFPLYYTFFSELGCPVILPDTVREEAFYRQVTSMCFPAQIAMGLYQDLIEKKPDYIFMPHLQEIFVPGGIDRKEFCATCLLVQGEAFWMRQAFRDTGSKVKLLSHTVNFNGGWEKGEQVFLEIAEEIGFSRKKAFSAFYSAITVQKKCEQELKDIGKQVLKSLKSDPDRFAIVLFGRVYNAYSDLANKGIPKKLTTRNNIVIPFDLLPYEDIPLGEDYREYMHWEAGQRILRAAEFVRQNDQLFGVYITNFLCAPDSFLISYFRRIMGTKPSLTLELDEHTADAGINTRIEAFLDIIRNYLEIQKDLKSYKDDFIPAQVISENGKVVYIDSSGKRFKLQDQKVKMILPSMGDLATPALAAVNEHFNIRTEPLPVADSEVLQLGRSVTTGKECLPMLICIGSLLKYLKYRKNSDEKLILFLPKAGGYCRLGQYHVYTNQYIREQKIPDTALITPAMEENFLALGPQWSIRAWRAITVSDVMADIRSTLLALSEDKDQALSIFSLEYNAIVTALREKSGSDFYSQLKKTARILKCIPLKIPFDQAPRIEVTGEIFVRRDSFSNLGIVKRLYEKGFVVTVSPVAEWLNYVNYMIKNHLIEPRFNLLGKIDFLITDRVMHRIERKIKKILSSSGLFEMELIDIPDMMRYKHHVIPKTLTGEHDLITGMMLRDSLTKYCGVVSVGPFGCMQLRFSEAVAAPLANVPAKLEALKAAGESPVIPEFDNNDLIPFLTIESDGNPYPQLLEARFENFCLQAARVAERQGKQTAILDLS